MSPVHSFPSPSSRVRRRPVAKSALSLFPECPVVGPSSGCGNLAPVSGPSSAAACLPPSDCPPPVSVLPGSHIRAKDRARGVSVDPQQHPAHAGLVGIARLAASSSVAETKRTSSERPEYFLLPVKSILNRCDSVRVPFDWTLNPYRGCEYACKYCYARYTHEYMEIDGAEFEKKIFVKKDASALLAWDLSHKYSFTSPGPEGAQAEHIAIGTATDPYQPAEREYGVTRSCLEELAKREGLSISIITKSNQVVRDIDVLKRIAERSDLSVNITITTLRTRLARLLEPRAPRPDLRLAALKQLREAGISAGVSASPLIPGITDGEGALESVAAAAKEFGAQWFFSGVLFLMPASARQFIPFVREKFPKLAKQYEQWYSRSGYAPADYRKKASERVARIREKYGFGSRPWEGMRRKVACMQMPLAWNPVGADSPAGMRSCAAG